MCPEGCGTRCVSSWPVDSIGRVWGHLPPQKFLDSKFILKLTSVVSEDIINKLIML